jgi:haloalkane dehalogenase
MIGMGWATRFPHLIERIVVLNTAAFHLPRGKSFSVSLKLARIPGVSDLLVRGLGAFSRAANRLCVKRKPLAPEVARAYLAPYDSWQSRIAVHRFVQDIPLRKGDRAYAVVSETADKL